MIYKSVISVCSTLFNQNKQANKQKQLEKSKLDAYQQIW